MRFRNIALALGLAGAAAFVYGMLVESKNLKLERRTLKLPLWPERLNGFTIALLTDFHVRGPWSVELTQQAVDVALAANPDVIVIGGDLVDYWSKESETQLREALGRLSERAEDVLVIPGNHDYYLGTPRRLAPICEELGIRLLRNELVVHKGVSWVGIDSALSDLAKPYAAAENIEVWPAIALWHEGDVVDALPSGIALMLSGHSHGGQFRIPGVIRPYKRPVLGYKYDEGFYPKTSTPLYVSRGIGTTGPPSRFMCAPEVSLLTLESES